VHYIRYRDVYSGSEGGGVWFEHNVFARLNGDLCSVDNAQNIHSRDSNLDKVQYKFYKLGFLHFQKRNNIKPYK